MNDSDLKNIVFSTNTKTLHQTLRELKSNVANYYEW